MVEMNLHYCGRSALRSVTGYRLVQHCPIQRQVPLDEQRGLVTKSVPALANYFAMSIFGMRQFPFW